MAKRFTDNEKWKKQFFKSLSTVNKLFFLYILDDCDNAGIWHVEPEIAEIRLGESIDIATAKSELGKHIYEFDNGEKWFIPSFIEFQYGVLNPNVNAHKSVIDKLKKRNLLKLYEQLINCSSRDMDMDMDMDMDKDKDMDKVKEIEKWFNVFWKEYPKKVDKKETNDLFKKLCTSQIIFNEIMTGVRTLKNTDGWKKEKGKYIPSPARLLRKEKWKDEVNPDVSQITNNIIPLSQRID